MKPQTIPLGLKLSPLSKPSWINVGIRVALLALSFGLFLLREPAETNAFAFYLNYGWADLGAQHLFRGLLYLLHGTHPSRAFLTSDIFTLQAIFFCVLSAVLLLPRVPLLVLAGGQLALLCVWWIFGDISMHAHAIESWSVVLTAMWIVSLNYWKGDIFDYAVITPFAVVLGYMPLMRQSAMGTILLPFATVLGFGILAALVQTYMKWRENRRAGDFSVRSAAPSERRDGAPDEESRWLFRRYSFPITLFILFFLCAFKLETAILADYFGLPLNPHGSGWVLLESLGFDKNAYNGIYDDAYIVQQGLFIEGIPYDNSFSAHQQQKEMEEWRHRVLEDPVLFIKGLLTKTIYLVRYFTATLGVGESAADQLPIPPSFLTLALGAAFCVSSVYCVRKFSKFACEPMALVAVATFGLAAACIAPLIVIIPYRLGSAVALILVLTFIISPSVYFVAREKDDTPAIERRRNMLSYKVCVGLVILCALPAIPYAAYRTVVNRRQALAILKGNPVTKFRVLGRDVSYRFNRLKPDERRAFIASLLKPEYSRYVFRPLRSQEFPGLFKPELALCENDILFVIANTSADWKRPEPSWVMGKRNSTLYAYKNSNKLTGMMQQWEPYDTTTIHDGDWDGRDYMFCLPARPGTSKGLQFLGVNAYNIVGGDDNKGLVLEPISGAALYRGDAPKAAPSPAK